MFHSELSTAQSPSRLAVVPAPNRAACSESHPVRHETSCATGLPEARLATMSRRSARPRFNPARIGLDGDGELVYRTLLLRRRWDLAVLSESTGLPRPRLDEVMRELCRFGVVRPSQDDPDAVRAVEPAIALPGLAAQRIGRSATARRITASALERFVALHEKSDRRFSDEGELPSVDDACAVVERLAAHTRSELTFLVPSYVPDGPQFSEPILDAMLRRGVKVRTIWGRRVAGHPEAWEHGRRLGAHDIAPRVVASVPVCAVLLDSDVAVVLPENGAPRITRDAAEVEQLVGLANHLQDTSADIVGLSRQLPVGVPERPRCEQVLRLLAEGLTDDAMARKLGCSVRTIRNEVAAAMSALDARSRFQAGVRAMQAGLI